MSDGAEKQEPHIAVNQLAKEHRCLYPIRDTLEKALWKTHTTGCVQVGRNCTCGKTEAERIYKAVSTLRTENAQIVEHALGVVDEKNEWMDKAETMRQENAALKAAVAELTAEDARLIAEQERGVKRHVLLAYAERVAGLGGSDCRDKSYTIANLKYWVRQLYEERCALVEAIDKASRERYSIVLRGHEGAKHCGECGVSHKPGFKCPCDVLLPHAESEAQ